MGRFHTLAVVVGVACSGTTAAASPNRFVQRAILAVGFEDPAPTSTPQELIKKGIDEFRLGNYEQSSRAFEQASRMPGLSEREQQMVAEHRALLIRVNKARQEAADQLAGAHRAFEQGDREQANALANAVVANGYAPAEVRDEAKSLVARIQSGEKPAPPSANTQTRRQAQQLIASARQQLRERRLDEAETLARKAMSLNVQYGAWEDTPAKVLKDVSDARTAQARSTGTATPATGDAKARAKALVTEAQSNLQRNELDKAEELAQQAKVIKTTFYFFETSPDDILSEVAKAREAAATSDAGATASVPAGEAAPSSTPTGDGSITLVSKENEVPAAAETSGEAESPATETSETTEPPATSTEMPQEGPALGGSPMSDEQKQAAARQLLAQARKLIDSGHLDHAESLIVQAEGYQVNWGEAGDPAAQMRQELNQARASASHSPGEAAAPDSRLEALELLREGRTQLRAGNFDAAEQLALQANSKKAQYRLLDDTPNQLLSEIARARKGTGSTSTKSLPADVAAIPTTRPTGGTKEANRQAQTLLKKAREYMGKGDYDNAIEIARRVNGWGLEYSLFWDDTPAKVESAAKAMRSRAIARATREQGDKDRAVAESLVAEARRDLAKGQLDEAEAKAKQAQQLRINYGRRGDRPEHVLADVAKARIAAGRNQKIAPQPVEVASPTAVAQTPATTAQPTAEPQVASNQPAKPAQPASPPVQQPAAKSNQPPAEAMEWLSGARRAPLANNATPNEQAAMPEADEQPAQEIKLASNETPADEPTAVVRVGDQPPSSDAMPIGDPDERKLMLARESFEAGNYPRARELAGEVAGMNESLRPQAEELMARVAVAEQATIVQLYDAGVAALKKQEYARALTFFQQVAASQAPLDPAMEQQLRGYLRDLPARVGTKSNNGGSVRVQDGVVQVSQTEPSIQTDMDPGQRERVKFQQLVTETNLKVQTAKRLLPTEPASAIKELESAQENVRSSGLDESMTLPLMRRLDAAIRMASVEKQRIDFEQLQDKAREATKVQNERRLAVEQQKQQEIKELIERGNALMKEAKFDEAEVVFRRAYEIDPDNPAAIAGAYKAKIEGRLAVSRDIKDRAEAGFVDTMNSVDRAAIPHDDSVPISYPPPRDWADLTNRRNQKFGELQNMGRSARELEIQRKLSDPISVNFTETPLAEVVSFLRDATGVEIVLDKHALELDGISSDRPVTMQLEKIPLKSALNLLLGQLDLDYTIDNDVLLITTPVRKQGKLYVETYWVGDLVSPLPNFTGTNGAAGGAPIPGGPIGVGPNSGAANPSAALAQFGTGLGGSAPMAGATGNGSVGTMLAGGLGNAPLGGTGQQVDFDSLVQLIEQTISPNSWDAVGGPGTMEPFAPNLSLVVNQTQAVHEEISDLLTQLRRLQDLQVTVEVKFISLTEDFFERIGIDFDIDVQSNQQKPLRSFGSTLVPATTGTGGGAGGGGTFTPPVLNLFYGDHEDDFAVGVGEPRGSNGLGQSGRPPFTSDLKIPFRTGLRTFTGGRPQGFVAGDGLNFGIAFLSDIEVYLFLEAAQQNNRGNVLQAPKVTLFNGQTAFVFSGRIEPFVIALNPVVAAGAVAFDPQIAQFFNGAFLSVTAVISADRRYVRLTLVPQFTSIAGEKRFTVTGGAGGFGGGGGVGGGGGGAANAQAEIVVPIVATNFVLTAVSVPDGGTVLLGGLKTKSEIRNETGVPILNKLPYINRLYSSTGVSSLTTSLMLMVTPRIIIQEEEEELLGKTVAF